MFYQAFLSTLSLRRATVKIGIDFIDGINFYPRSPCGERHHYLIPKIGTLHFYPRSPCGERRQIKQTCRAETSISIHALLAESDVLNPLETLIILIFLSTLSLRRATAKKLQNNKKELRISIHALLAESDDTNAKLNTKNLLFLSTLSLRRATHLSMCNTPLKVFLSTLSLRRATA